MIVSFLAGEGRDAAGRRFADVIAFNDRQLETRHDFIQWLFPLAEPSRAVPQSPVLDAAAIAALRASPMAQARLVQAAELMLVFYASTDAWRARFDHNHLRITRITKSLRLLSGDVAADRFKARIAELAEGAPIDRSARDFWDAA